MFGGIPLRISFAPAYVSEWSRHYCTHTLRFSPFCRKVYKFSIMICAHDIRTFSTINGKRMRKHWRYRRHGKLVFSCLQRTHFLMLLAKHLTILRLCARGENDSIVMIMEVWWNQTSAEGLFSTLHRLCPVSSLNIQTFLHHTYKRTPTNFNRIQLMRTYIRIRSPDDRVNAMPNETNILPNVGVVLFISFKRCKDYPL